MTRHAALALPAFALVLVLSGCGTQNRGLESVHQPVVTRTDYVYDMPAPGGDRVAANDEALLVGWFDSLKLRYGDRVAIDTQGYGPRARDAIGTVASRYGLLIDETAPVTQGVIPSGSVRVIVSRTAASVPGCPDFSRTMLPEFGGNTHSNYGCGVNSTLAAMIADPRDLVQGRTETRLGDNTAAGTAIRNYRAGTVKSLKNESSKGGN